MLKRNSHRVVFSLTVSAIVPTILLMIWQCLEGDALGLRIGFFIFLCVLVYVFVFGFPVFIYTKENDFIRWWTGLIGGFVVAFIPSALFLRVVSNNYSGIIPIAGVIGILGAIGGVATCLAWKATEEKTLS